MGRGLTEDRRDGHPIVQLRDLDADTGVVPCVPFLENTEFLGSEDRGVWIVQALEETIQRLFPEGGVTEGGLVIVHNALEGPQKYLALHRGIHTGPLTGFSDADEGIGDLPGPKLGEEEKPKKNRSGFSQHGSVVSCRRLVQRLDRLSKLIQ